MSKALLATHKDEFMKNAILESRLIHARNLLEFFEGKESKQGNIRCFHYDFPTDLVGVKKEDQDRLHKEIAHLTYSRIKRTEKDWPHEVLTKPILDRCLSFAEYVLKNKLTGREKKIDHWEALRRELAKQATYSISVYSSLVRSTSSTQIHIRTREGKDLIKY